MYNIGLKIKATDRTPVPDDAMKFYEPILKWTACCFYLNKKEPMVVKFEEGLKIYHEY